MEARPYEETLSTDWNEVLGAWEYEPIAYTRASLDYQQEYMKYSAEHPTGGMVDLSQVLFHEGRPVGIWPLSLKKTKEGNWHFVTNQGPVKPPLFIPGFSRKRLNGCQEDCLLAMRRLHDAYISSGGGFSMIDGRGKYPLQNSPFIGSSFGGNEDAWNMVLVRL